MKKIFLGMIISLLFILTGCQDNNKLTKEMVENKAKDECASFQPITAGYFGGGEMDRRGYVKIGYCDDNLVSLESWSQSETIEYEKRLYEFNNDSSLNPSFSNTIYYIDNNYTNSLFVSVVVARDNLMNFANNLRDSFLPLVSTMSNYNNITINIYTTDDMDINQEKYKIFLGLTTNGKISTYDDEFDQTDYNNVAAPFYNITAYSSSGDMQQQIEEDINTFSNKI